MQPFKISVQCKRDLIIVRSRILIVRNIFSCYLCVGKEANRAKWFGAGPGKAMGGG